MITLKKTRNCEGTHRLQNKTNRNVLASKLIATCENFSKKVKIFPKKNSKTMHRRKKFPRIKSVFFHLLLLCTKFQSPRSNNEFFFTSRSP